jgi:RNA polymerase sigma factor (TIGR02999 family)
VSTSIGSLITNADRGDGTAARALFTVLYTELHGMARRELARRDGGSVGATSLLHEAYLAMAAREGPTFPDRARFMAYAARVMRGLIVDHARLRRAAKRGGGFEITALGTDVAQAVSDGGQLDRIAEALDALSGYEPGLAEVVDLKFFCGFSFAEIAAMQRVSERTVQRQWEKARIYLHHTLNGEAALDEG